MLTRLRRQDVTLRRSAVPKLRRNLLLGSPVVAVCTALLVTIGFAGTTDSFKLASLSRTADDPPGGGVGRGGPVGSHHRGSGLRAQNDEYSFTSRGYAVLAVFRNDSYPAGTNASWYQPSYGSVQLIECEAGETCFYYEPSDADRSGPDEFEYTLVSPQGYRSTARVSIEMP